MSFSDLEIVTTDCQRLPNRRLQKKFSSKAIGTTAPNALNSNKPKLSDAMGITPKSGILSYFHDGAQQTINVYEWHAGRNRMNVAKGWLLCAESAALGGKDVLPDAIASVKITPGVPFFLQAATSAIDNCWVTGPEHDLNPNTDNTDGA